MKSVTVQLETKTQTGTDILNHPTYTSTYETVKGVLVGEPTTEDITDAMTMHNAKCTYVVAAPKGDAHDWVDKKVILENGEIFHTIGRPTEGIPENIPGRWNRKIKLEQIDGN